MTRNGTSRAFVRGVAFGAVSLFVLIWLFPELAPVSSGGDRDRRYDHLPTLERAQHAGVVRVGFANEAPYAYLDPASGELTGEAPVVARAVLQRLGVGRVEGVLTEFGSLIPGLQAGRFDLIAAGMYITPRRCEQVGFSNPSYRSSAAMLVRSGNPAGLHSYADVARAGVTIGVVTGAIERTYALAAGVAADRVSVFPDATTALEAVAAGRITGFAATGLTVNDLLRKAGDPSLARATPFADPIVDGKPTPGYGAFAFRREDEPFRIAFDRELAALIGTPEHLAMVAPFGITAAELPGDATAIALCEP